MTCCSALVWIDAHEQLADLGELSHELMIVGNELLHGFVVAEVSEIAKNGHEPFGLEREAVNFHFGTGICREDDVFAFNLVGEEGCDDGKDAGNDIVMSTT